ncbi:MAG: CAP domain-containing protein [Myxococcota bacterium]
MSTRGTIGCISLLLLAATAAGGGGLRAAGASRATARSYERWVRPRPLSADERRVVQIVRRWAAEGGRNVRPDARLHRTAQVLLPSVPTAPGAALDIERARAEANRWGWTDGQLAAASLSLPPGTNLHRALRQQLTAEIADLDINRAGVAVGNRGHDRVVLVLFSRRMVSLLPVRSRVTRQADVRIAGFVRGVALPGETRLTLVVQRPDGSIDRTQLELHGHNFAHALPVGRRRGIVRAELLLDRGRGPEIAAVFPIGVDASPHEQVPSASAVGPAPEPVGEDETEAALVALILGSRAAQGLPLPAQSARLVDAARGHARDMHDHEFFAHVSPTTGDVTDRLREGGVPYARALENIAIASSAEAAFQQWMVSPAHRANLLDPEVDTLGVGVEIRPTDNGAKVYAVAVLARLADDGSAAELARRAHGSIKKQRSRLGLAPLAADRRLDALAARHSREIAGVRQVIETSPIRGNLIDTVFRELDVHEAAVDVYLSTTVAVVERSKHIRARFSRVGVGVHRDRGAGDGRLWVTVIYAAD